jgi:phospho-N-acetylmuramoyl-pentapeptide-transferase
MLYYLFEFLERRYDLPGAGLFQYVSFRSAMSIIVALIISVIFGNRIIRSLKSLQIGESVRDLGLKGQTEKTGTPTMGGIIIVLAVVVPTLLFTRLDNIYIVVLLISTIWLAFIGAIDDYIKVFQKNKAGLESKFKILGQVVLGCLIGAIMFWHQDVVVRVPYEEAVRKGFPIVQEISLPGDDVISTASPDYAYVKTGLTNMPFFKGNNLNYRAVLFFLEDNRDALYWIFFIPFVILIVTAVSNGANLTDGLDGLAAGSSAIIVTTLAIFAYVSSNVQFATYLDILYIPGSQEIVIFSAAMIGACVGFLWYNSYPAKVFMGDTGSLALGGIIASMAILLRKELLIPLLCGIFLIENLSVLLQVSYFKYTKKRYGEGRRIFLMSPLHHHYQKMGMHEVKIVTRFWIVGILLAIFTIVTLKVR